MKIKFKSSRVLIITIILIILIVLIYVFFIGSVVKLLIKEKIRENLLKPLEFDLKIQSAYISSDNQTIYVFLKRNIERENISKLKFIFKDNSGNNFVYFYSLLDGILNESENKSYSIAAKDVKNQINDSGFDFSEIDTINLEFVNKTSSGKENNKPKGGSGNSGGGSSGGSGNGIVPLVYEEDDEINFVSPTSIEGMSITPSGETALGEYSNLGFVIDGDISTTGYWNIDTDNPAYGAIKASINPIFSGAVRIFRYGKNVNTSVWVYYDDSWHKIANCTKRSSFEYQVFVISPAKNISSVAVEFCKSYSGGIRVSKFHDIREIEFVSVSSKSMAGFFASSIKGYKPWTVSFTDVSTNNPETWFWDFGDGTTSTEQNPVHTYNNEGTYTVKLTTTNNTNTKTKTKTNFITVNIPMPVADFKVSQPIGIIPLTINFIDTSSNYPETWLWDFGDGTTSTEQNPVHTYNYVGNYVVNLTVTNSIGKSSKVTDVQTVVALVKHNYLMVGHGINYSQPGCDTNLWACSDNYLYIWGSDDGIYWEILSPRLMNLRDPSILQYNGKYYIASTGFVVWVSEDLIYWKQIYSAPSNFPGNKWAPEWFVDDDGSIHIFISGIYETHPINNDFTNWSAPVLLTDNNSNSLRLGSTAIDPYMVKVDDTYYLWYKKKEPVTGYASSKNLTSNYTDVKPAGYTGNWSNPEDRARGDWAVWGAREGPSLIKWNETTWRMYFEHTILEVEYSDSYDNWATWTTPKPLTYNSGELLAGHGTVIKWNDIGIGEGNLSSANLFTRLWEFLKRLFFDNIII